MSRPQAALTTWWKKYAPETGRVVRTLSPYEQRPKALRKVQENALVLVPSFFLLWGTVAWAKGENDRYHRTHWA
ncbi:hypothetical protein SPRG_12632 [Saprolegnia parasitica CBS 223.65]|uniref:Uncharacterized protein n=1 Tax=Saprolegnia parasitica (strain CBS 223.65) TaxID=695850 RepID=A0A067BY93_SAPPC|nr:hypothetical protein SPRG_12632 [Saprolegnia parasitica CBS 223.65]KDO21815.1 hypothetical protein SPRG_12632 [Saprolegnia parasitica CBS 223.65]|eukprot:XP_012207492.1 hypothetical protein SPRG_12632 [Saprolegnia parasitica CBS 223.65]